MDRWVGIVVSGAEAVMVDATVPEDGPIVVQNDHKLKLPKGPREQAYSLVHQQCANYLREHEIDRAFVMASAAARVGGGGVAHLESAELRGVITAAAASVCPTQQLKKASISKTFGERKSDDYLKDDDFWEKNVDGEVRAGSRMAALLLLSARQSK